MSIRIRNAIVACSVLKLAALSGCAEHEASSDGAVATNEAAIIKGTDLSDAEARASGVVMLTTIKTATSYALCTGTLIGSDWILTAAHCFEAAKDADGNGEIDQPGQTKARLGNKSDTSAQQRVATRVVKHTSGTWETGGQVDAALVQVSPPFDLSEIPAAHFTAGTTAPRLAMYPLSNGSLYGTTLRLMGYGANAGQVVNGQPYNVSGAGTTLRSTQNSVWDWSPTTVTYGSHWGEQLTCFGDSGGPAFLEDWAYDGITWDFKLRNRYFVGVHSKSTCESYPYESIDIGAEAFRSWVETTAGSYETRVSLNCTGSACSTSPQALPNNVNWTGAYAPEGADPYYCYYVTATYDMESNYDYVTFAGTKLTGSGTYSTHYCGALPINMQTDYSVSSSGFSLSATNVHYSVNTSSCTGTPGNWSACSGDGCSVCIGHTKGYPKYFDNHPKCNPNVACGDTALNRGTCNSNCPAPTAADR